MITTEKLFDENSSSIYNASTVSTYIAKTTSSEHLMHDFLAKEPKVVTTSTSSYNSTSSSSGSLSGGQIAGISIPILILIVCVGLLGCCKSGRWETRRVW
ncbi:unnamed protein product, partial [Rotaria sp. Silwood2]